MRYAALDGWRGVCALLVALYHLTAFGHLTELPLVRGGYLFVDFFFVLSGFVIAHAYGDELAARRGFRRFVQRRAGRLLPLHCAVLALMVAMEAARALMLASGGHQSMLPAFSGERALVAIPLHLLLLQSFGLLDQATWNVPSWSIAAEFHTYLVFAAVCWFGRRQRDRLAVLLAALGAAVLLRWAASMDTQHDYGFARCLYGFFCGVLVHRARARHPPNGQPGGPGATLLEWLVLAAVAGFVALDQRSPLGFAAPLLFSLAVYVYSAERGGLSRLLRSAPLQRLGQWSYAVYMVHMLVGAALHICVHLAERRVGHSLYHADFHGEGRPGVDLGNLWADDLLMLGYVAAVLLLAALSHRLIELPAQRWARAAGLRLAPAGSVTPVTDEQLEESRLPR